MAADRRTGEADGRSITLAFELTAIEQLADPRAVFADASRWSRYVGVVGEDTSTVAAFVEHHGLTQDYELGDLDRHHVLSKLTWEADTDRYVFVGVSETDEELAAYVGWEYVPVEEAAEAADWPFVDEISLLGRVRVRLERWLPTWP